MQGAINLELFSTTKFYLCMHIPQYMPNLSRYRPRQIFIRRYTFCHELTAGFDLKCRLRLKRS
jgi:hypothetical protein